MSSLISAAQSLGQRALGGISSKSKSVEVDVLLFEISNEELITFLKAYRWLETDYTYPYPSRPTDTELQIEFLLNQKHGIRSWLILAPQRQESFGPAFHVERVGYFAVKNRSRIEERGFQVFGEPDHRMTAAFLAGVSDEPNKAHLANANAATMALRDEHRGIFLFYPVRQEKKDLVSIGFELLFPHNKLPFDMNFTVRRKSDAATVDANNPAEVNRR